MYRLIVLFILLSIKLLAKEPVIVYSEKVSQGDLVYFASDEKFEKISLLSAKGTPRVSAKAFTFKTNKTYYFALLGIDPSIKEGKYDFEITFPKNKYKRSIEVEKYPFKESFVALSQTKSDLILKPTPQGKKESIELWDIIGEMGDKRIFHYDKTSSPIKEKIIRTSFFGDARIYQNKDTKKMISKTFHYGNDFYSASRENTKVFSIGRGIVVLAKERKVSGNTVIIQHLPGVFSLYFHLSEIAVKKGKVINTGSYIGKIGQTGLATGPHLHLEIRVNGVALNSDFFEKKGIVNKNEIINKIINNKK